MLTARLAPGRIGIVTGSLASTRPAATRAVVEPPKRTRRLVRGTVSTAPEPLATAIRTSGKGAVGWPKRFERGIRTLPPPSVVCTTSRTVRPPVPSWNGIVEPAGPGRTAGVAQVATHGDRAGGFAAAAAGASRGDAAARGATVG